MDLLRLFGLHRAIEKTQASVLTISLNFGPSSKAIVYSILKWWVGLISSLVINLNHF